ncbi:MAG: insulinase family protein [Oscillospiraceae bacterium]|nr:insulinase family protein [Oscillospiraceae bacterium]
MCQTILLPNGIRLLTEPIPHVHSAAVGIWVGAGSRHEPQSQQGISHFIEHMVFKGTANRTTAQQAIEMDAVGGHFNAYTTRENTCYYARVLDSHLPIALDLLFDLFYNAKFSSADVLTEQKIILEEISMYEDTPDDLCVERLLAAVYPDQALGRPILGVPSSLSRITGADLRQYRNTHYLPGETVVALAGSFRPADVDALAAYCSRAEGTGRLAHAAAVYRPAVTVCKKDVEQNHLCLAFPALPYNHPKRFALQLLSTILGGSMSSRMFQEIREQRGLCYNTYTFSITHMDTGLLCLYAALSSEMEAQAISAICTLICQLVQDGVSEEELNRAREQVKSNLFLGMESVTSRMSHLARSTLLHGRVLSESELLAGYDAVTCSEIKTLARQIFDFSQCSLSVVGQVDEKTNYQSLLNPFLSQI